MEQSRGMMLHDSHAPTPKKGRTFLHEILANLQSEDALSIRERRASEKRGQKMRKRRIEGREREGEREREREIAKVVEKLMSSGDEQPPEGERYCSLAGWIL